MIAVLEEDFWFRAKRRSISLVRTSQEMWPLNSVKLIVSLRQTDGCCVC